jgi:hypothetical protein
VSAVANPAYDSTTISLRSLAVQVGADLDEVVRDYESGDLRRYLVRTDNRGPAPELVTAAQRSHERQEDIAVRQALLDERGARIGVGRPMSQRQMGLELARRRMQMQMGEPCFGKNGRQAVAELIGRRIEWETPKTSVRQNICELHRRRIDWDVPADERRGATWNSFGGI